MIQDVRNAVSFLTVLRIGAAPDRAPGKAFAWFPLVGLLIGLILIAVSAALPDTIRPMLLLITWIVLTGGLHLDGFADTCDGVFATTTADRRLEIMRDPRTGSWAVIGLIVLLLSKWSLLHSVNGAWLIAAPVLGRWSMVLAASAFPYARSTGLGAYFREGLGRSQVTVSSGLVFIILAVLAAVSSAAIVLALLAVVISLGFARWSSGRLGGGLTGDVYGAVCEMTEWLILLGAVWLAT